MRPACYFPVEERALRMRAGLAPLGTDFGNGPRDALLFQADEERATTVRAKAAPALRGSQQPLCSRHRVVDDEAHPAVLEWVRRTLAREQPDHFDAKGARGSFAEETTSDFDALLRHVQEDAVIIRRHVDGSDAATMLHVCFPSRWRPEALLGASFREIHAPVPGFADRDAFATSMLRAMIDRGPYVRFVWTLCADDALDHHPDEGLHTPWPNAELGFLRVERQLTIGFPEQHASLFLIRTYLYSFAELGAERRAALGRAVDAMPGPVRSYKGIEGHERSIHRLLEAAGRDLEHADGDARDCGTLRGSRRHRASSEQKGSA